MGVSKNRGIPKSSNLIEFSIINHPFWGTSIFGNTHIPWERSHIPYRKFGTFESMIFRLNPQVGYVIVPWRIFGVNVVLVCLGVVSVVSCHFCVMFQAEQRAH